MPAELAGEAKQQRTMAQAQTPLTRIIRVAPALAKPSFTRFPGAMQHAALRGVMLRRTGIVSNATLRYGPGSAAHRFARAARCAASGARSYTAVIFTGRL